MHSAFDVWRRRLDQHADASSRGHRFAQYFQAFDVASSGPRIAKPVALPRDRESGRFGSRSSESAPYITTGIVSDAAMLAAIASPPTARIASGLERTSSAAIAGIWSEGERRASITRLRASVKPSFASSATVASLNERTT